MFGWCLGGVFDTSLRCKAHGSNKEILMICEITETTTVHALDKADLHCDPKSWHYLLWNSRDC